MRNRRTLVVLAALFVVLLAAVILQEQVHAPAHVDDETAVATVVLTPAATPGDLTDLPVVFENFSVADIQTLRLAEPNGETSFTLERSADGSRWTAPDLDGELDVDTAQVIASTVTLLPYLEIVPTSEETNLTDYGFVTSNTTAIAVEITLLDGEQHVIFLGGLNPDGNGFYAIVDQREGFYVLDARPIEFLRQQLRNPPTRLTTD